MKTYIKITMILFAMLLTCGSISAQNQKERKSREEFAEIQAKHIAHDLALNDKTTAQLVEVYLKQQREIWALGPRPGRQNEGNETQSEKAIQERFQRSQQILTIREKYYKEYSKFLTQKQIERMYEIERKMMKRLANRGQRGPRQHRRQ